MLRTVRRKPALAAALVTPLLLIGAGACGGEDAAPSSSGTATTTPTATATPVQIPTPTDHPPEEPTDEGPDPAAGTKVEDPARIFSAMEQAMQDARTARVSMDMGHGTANGAISYESGATDMALTMEMGESTGGLGTVDMRYVDGVMYLSMPPVTKPGKFFRFDSSSRTLGPVVSQMQSLTPEASVEMMARSVRKLTRVGEERLGGEPTTHYVLQVDTAEAMRLLGQTELPGGATTPELPETLEYDLWVTDDDLMRRIVMNIDTMSMQLDYTDWGRPVTIKAPAAADVLKSPPGL